MHELVRAKVDRHELQQSIGAAEQRARRFALAAVALAALATLAGCSGNGTGPVHSSPGVHFIAGNAQSDTVQTTLIQALVVRVTTPQGKPAAHQVVQFTSVLNAAGAQVYAEPLDSPNPSEFIADSTDGSGEVSVVVVLGTVAGPGHLVVGVPVYGYSDTAVFTIEAGNAAALSVSPSDTAVFVDSSVAYTPAVVDRFGNHRTDPVSLSVASGPATLSGLHATATGVGRVIMVATAGTAVDTVALSVVPPGVLATGISGGVVMFNLDGSNYHQIATVPAGTLKWAPSATHLVFDQTGGGQSEGNGLIEAVDLSGNVTTVDNSAAVLQWPQVSRDGVWVYYCRIVGGVTSANWRAHLDGSGSSDSLPSQMPDFDIFETPSPDGLHIAYVADLSTITDLRVLTLATGAVTSLHVNAWSPTWSPTSDLIAYLSAPGNPAPISVIHATGAGARILTADLYFTNIDWSPDGQWIVARNARTAKIDLVNATSGETLPLPYTGTQFSPTWKPK